MEDPYLAFENTADGQPVRLTTFAQGKPSAVGFGFYVIPSVRGIFVFDSGFRLRPTYPA
jgi:hypothetical protein